MVPVRAFTSGSCLTPQLSSMACAHPQHTLLTCSTQHGSDLELSVSIVSQCVPETVCQMEDVDSDDSFPILWVSGLDQL